MTISSAAAVLHNDPDPRLGLGLQPRDPPDTLPGHALTGLLMACGGAGVRGAYICRDVVAYWTRHRAGNRLIPSSNPACERNKAASSWRSLGCRFRCDGRIHHKDFFFISVILPWREACSCPCPCPCRHRLHQLFLLGG